MTGIPPPIARLALTLAALTALPSGAGAQNQAETASRWGLIGTWALDCSKPAGNDNGYLTYAIRRAGHLTHERDFGDRQDSNEVEEVNIGAGGALELIVSYPMLKQARRYSLIMGPDGRTRAMSNSKTDGTEQTIKDGKFTYDGKATPWQVRCR